MASKEALPPLYYSESGFWLKDRAGSRFLPIQRGDLPGVCALRDLSVPEKAGLSKFDTLRARVVTENFVDYANPLAGHRTGLFATSDGRRILVTSEPAAVFDEPGKRGPVDFIERTCAGLFGDGEQLQCVIYWLKVAVEVLRFGTFGPGQLLVLAGPRECGKSFFHFLITELLGGRVGKPYKFMTGQTPFNADLAQAESLVIEDEAAHKDIRSRRAFGYSIKQLCANESFDVHGKNKQAITLPTFRRISCSLNEEADDLLVLPPMDHTDSDSLIDKVILIKCSRANLSPDRKSNRARLLRELPAFRRYLSDVKIPKDRQSTRFGVKAWHHPELLDRLVELSPESALLDYLDRALFADSDKLDSWKGTATELESRLIKADPGAGRLFYHTAACGQALAKLAAKFPARFQQSRSQGKVRWQIKAP